MRTIRFFVCLSLVGQVVMAQLGPGYMGKRFVAGYGFYCSPALWHSNGSEASIFESGNSTGGELAFNSMHEGFIEYSYKNRASIGFSAKYFHTSYNNRMELNAYYNYPEGFYHIKGFNYSLYFKFYHKRYVAPWGRYLILGPAFTMYNCTYDPSTMYVVFDDYNSGSQTRFNNFGPTEQQYMRGDIRLGWGRSRIAFNRLTLDYGVNFEVMAFALSLGGIVDGSIADILNTTPTNLDYVKVTSRKRVREMSRTNVFFKVGYLLF